MSRGKRGRVGFARGQVEVEPRVRSDHPVHRQPERPLVRPYTRLRAVTELAIDRSRTVSRPCEQPLEMADPLAAVAAAQNRLVSHVATPCLCCAALFWGCCTGDQGPRRMASSHVYAAHAS